MVTPSMPADLPSRSFYLYVLASWIFLRAVMGSTCDLLLAFFTVPRPPIEVRKLAVGAATTTTTSSSPTPSWRALGRRRGPSRGVSLVYLKSDRSNLLSTGRWIKCQMIWLSSEQFVCWNREELWYNLPGMATPTVPADTSRQVLFAIRDKTMLREVDTGQVLFAVLPCFRVDALFWGSDSW